MANKIIALILFASALGCSEADQDKYWPREQFELADGKVVECRWIERESCGLRLTDCTDGQTYRCETNVIER